MSEPIIRVENLSKSYVLKHQQREQYVALRDIISQKTKSLFTKQPQQSTPSSELFYALKDINFEVNQGERIGIIGRNGAGKSTLLKILSRITEPTRGTITLDGRVASLLEVGTGFHPELSGRENIFLNGAILGMSKAEIKSKFDEIVAFSEVEKFLDTPVKRYSSGMYVRLAFAVAAHLEPEILIVDEVLAVGDAQFQKKCLGKMQEVSAEHGRTVLFVSHNMSAISALCETTLFLENGKIAEIGLTKKILSSYVYSGGKNKAETKDDSLPAEGKKLKIRKVKVLNAELQVMAELNNAHKGFVEITFEVFVIGRGYNVSLELHDLQHGAIFTSALKDIDPIKSDEQFWEKGLHTYLIEVPLYLLREGDYFISVGSAIPKVEELDNYKYDTQFFLTDTISPIAKTTEGRRGVILPVIEWKKV